MKSWKRKLRMGMVGGGPRAFIGGVHRMAASLDRQVELVAGCFSRDPGKTKQSCAELYLDATRCYDTFGEMAAAEAVLPAGKRIDFVSIVTPNASHFAIAKTFLEAGFHVVCDKPVTFSLEEAEELAGIVEKTELVFALTHNYTGYPLVRHARELFRSGQMGTVRKVIVEYLQDWLAQPLEETRHKQAAWRVDPAQAGLGGALGDIGVHALNLFEYITGDQVTHLACDKTAFVSGRKLDDDANVLLRLSGGGKGFLTASQIAVGEENGLRIRIYGSEGAIAWEQENPNYLHVCLYGQPRQTLTRGQGYLSSRAADMTRIPPGHPEGYIEAFANIYCGAVKAIRSHIDGAPVKPAEYDFPTVHDGVRGMRFITAAVRSAEKNAAWVEM